MINTCSIIISFIKLRNPGFLIQNRKTTMNRLMICPVLTLDYAHLHNLNRCLGNTINILYVDFYHNFTFVLFQALQIALEGIEALGKMTTKQREYVIKVYGFSTLPCILYVCYKFICMKSLRYIGLHIGIDFEHS